MVAYVIVTDQSPLQAKDLRTFLHKRLPPFMLPAAYVFLDTLPLTANGKVDWKALPPAELGADRQVHEVAEPETPMQQQLRGLWEVLLNTRPIRITDDFFELGGHSLLSMQLVARIEETIGIKVPLASFFHNTTIKQLAEVIQQEEEREYGSPLIEVRAGGAKPPFFFLHGAVNGTGFYARKFAEHLDADQPFYVIPPYGSNGEAVPLTVDAMATAHLQTLRAKQPKGPYLLGGFCNGGVVAFEMARQLEAQGEEVPLLALLHADVPRELYPRLVHTTISRAGSLMRLSPDQQYAFYGLLRYMKGWWRDFRALERKQQMQVMRTMFWTGLPRIRQRGHAQTALQLLMEASRRDKLAPFEWALAGYKPGKYGGSVTLLWGADERQSRRDPSMGWADVAGKVEVQIVPGSHATLVAHASEIAEHIGICVARVRSQTVDGGALAVESRQVSEPQVHTLDEENDGLSRHDQLLSSA